MPNALSYFGVKRGGASDSRTKVNEAVDRFKRIALDEERGGNVCTLSHDFGSKTIAGVRKAIQEVLEIAVTMSYQSCIVGRRKVSEENLADFGFRSESGKIEKFAISTGTEKNTSIYCSKGMFQEH